MPYTIETQHWVGHDREQTFHDFDTLEAAQRFLSTRISYGYKRTWIKNWELEGQKTPSLDELRVMFEKPERRPFATNPATYAQADANRPVGVKSGDAVQFINRE